MNLKILSLLPVFLLFTLAGSGQGRAYKKGYLILKGNIIQEGYIKHSLGSWSIFKSTPGQLKIKYGPKSKPYKTKDDVVGFVIESDSFTIKKNIRINNRAASFTQDFVKVIETGKINLYLHQCTSTTNTGVVVGGVIEFGVVNGHETWILKKGAKEVVINKLKRHKESVIELISDNEELVKAIEKRRLIDINLAELIRKYNESSVNAAKIHKKG